MSQSDTAAPQVSIERASAVATVVMNRPPANAMTPEFIGAIVDAVEELGADASVRVIVLRSALERIFMAGADLGAMAQRVGADSADQRIGELSHRLARIERVEKPVVAAIRGHALGGGCELALCCDYRLMVDDGRVGIGQTEVGLGLIPGGGGTQRLPRLIGKGPAMRMIFESVRARAPQALAVGLVDAVFSPEEFDAGVEAKALQLAGLATRAVGLAKRAMLDGLDVPLAEGLDIESRAFAESLATEDVKEGVGAFLEKRAPTFQGR